MPGKDAQKKNPALEPFAPFIGEWTTIGTHPLVPDKSFHGRTIIEWIEGGAFIMFRSETDEPEIPSGLSILGSDDVAKTFFILYFDERGVSRKIDVSIEGKTMRWTRETPEFSQHRELTLSEDGKRITSKGEMSRNGGPWEGDLELIFARTS